jgi:hypothetical protein
MESFKYKVVTEHDGVGGEREIARFSNSVSDAEIESVLPNKYIRPYEIKVYKSIEDYEENNPVSIKKRALAKLTDQEKQVLGLK